MAVAGTSSLPPPMRAAQHWPHTECPFSSCIQALGSVYGRPQTTHSRPLPPSAPPARTTFTTFTQFTTHYSHVQHTTFT